MEQFIDFDFDDVDALERSFIDPDFDANTGDFEFPKMAKWASDNNAGYAQ